MLIMHTAYHADNIRRRSDIAAAEAQCLQLISEFEEIERRKLVMRDRFEALQNEIEENKIVLAARLHARIPAEIFSEIFQYCCGTDQLEVFTRTRPRQRQWILPAVSRRWRAIALSTPQLWATLHFDIDRIVSAKRLENLDDIAKEIFKRSGRAPLAIAVTISRSGHDLLRAVLAESFRWKSFRISLSQLQTVTVLNDQRGNFPILEAIDISAPRPLAEPLNAFKTCPKLHTIGLSGGVLTRNVAAPWEKITNFSVLEPQDPEDLLQALESMPAIRYADIDLHFDNKLTNVSVSKSTNLSQLQSLLLTGPLSFVAHATLPVLAELSMEGCTIQFDDVAYRFVIAQVGLKTLELKSVRITSSELESIVQHLPRLERLELFGFEVDDSFFERITAGNGILPNLRTLHAAFCVHLSCSLLTMLESRIFRRLKDSQPNKDQGTAYLDSVYIGYRGGARMPDDLRDRRDALHGHGTHIEFGRDIGGIYGTYAPAIAEVMNRISTKRKKREEQKHLR
ncbi:hypothetical protein HGRIS_000218 [Hohenbuehelia grisea]|uniref:F-box domain-containing protein n=1 Tax=Hohenbuehelia grisea TaxID=104357 RepID=A0ABR3JRB2_9AGAR